MNFLVPSSVLNLLSLYKYSDVSINIGLPPANNFIILAANL